MRMRRMASRDQATAEGASMSTVKIIDEPLRPFFTIRTLAAYLDCTERAVRNWVADGELPSYKIGGMRRISADDVDRWLDARRVRGR